MAGRGMGIDGWGYRGEGTWRGGGIEGWRFREVGYRGVGTWQGGEGVQRGGGKEEWG